ncbi:MAG: hypothetical protein NTW94_06900 [Legionellales bacterium]|nr:hypothetical protein [Legionellales bacterium]
MHLEDLGRPFLDRVKQLTRESRQRRAEDKMNQTIRIRDLVAIAASDQNCGELEPFPSLYSRELEDLIRLRAHLGFLFDLVAADHRANYCTLNKSGRYQLKETHLNDITRLSTAEFFFTLKYP